MIDQIASKIDVIGLFQACVLGDNCVELNIRTLRPIYSFSYAKETCALSMNKSLFMWYTEIFTESDRPMDLIQFTANNLRHYH